MYIKSDSFFDERVSELIPNVEDTRFDGIELTLTDTKFEHA
jgi:hypothetical protein